MLMMVAASSLLFTATAVAAAARGAAAETTTAASSNSSSSSADEGEYTSKIGRGGGNLPSSCMSELAGVKSCVDVFTKGEAVPGRLTDQNAFRIPGLVYAEGVGLFAFVESCAYSHR